MKKIIIVAIVCFSFFAWQINIQAETLEIQNFPYIHQILDMNTDVFIGHNACGSTSAVMMTEFHNFHPSSSQFAGTYVYSPYVGFTDKSGEDYSNPIITSYIGPDNGPYDMTISGDHVHEIESGAHGYMITRYACPAGWCWGTSQVLFENYLENHGLIIKSTASDMFSVIKRNIKSGLPLVGHWTGHYFIIKGYNTGVNDNEENIIVNDPYGDKNNTWDGSTYGEGVTYSFPNVTSTTTIDRIFKVYPVGVYAEYPGFHTDGTSQAFVDVYKRLKASNKDIGWPNDNTEGDNDYDIYVHKLKSPTDPSYRIWLQDFINENENNTALILNEYQQENKAYLIKGAIRYLYLNNDGPYNYGMPFTDEITHRYADGPYNEEDDTIQAGNTIKVQKFRRVYELDNKLILDSKWIAPFTDYDNGRRTLVWKEGIEAEHFAVGEYEIQAMSCIEGDCPQNGDQIYVAKKGQEGDESLDKPWPLINHHIAGGTTGKWFLQPGQYYFFLHDSNGHRTTWSSSPRITEGNSQKAGDNDEGPIKLEPVKDFRFL